MILLNISFICNIMMYLSKNSINYCFHTLNLIQINRVLDRLIDKQFKEIINEVMAFKMHYITCLLEEVRLSLLYTTKKSTLK